MVCLLIFVEIYDRWWLYMYMDEQMYCRRRVYKYTYIRAWACELSWISSSACMMDVCWADGFMFVDPELHLLFVDKHSQRFSCALSDVLRRSLQRIMPGHLNEKAKKGWRKPYMRWKCAERVNMPAQRGEQVWWKVSTALHASIAHASWSTMSQWSQGCWYLLAKLRMSNSELQTGQQNIDILQDRRRLNLIEPIWG